MESGSNYNSPGISEKEFYISGINSANEKMNTDLIIFFNCSAPPGPPGLGPGPGPGKPPATTANNIIKINNNFSKAVEICFLFNEPNYLSIYYTISSNNPAPGGSGSAPPTDLKSGVLYNITNEYMCLSISLSSKTANSFPLAFIIYYNNNIAMEYKFNVELNE